MYMSEDTGKFKVRMWTIFITVDISVA